jgi:hypothetical protein
MKTIGIYRWWLMLWVALACVEAAIAAGVPVSDIAPVAKRRPTVELAQRLATAPAPVALAPDVVLPFNPVAFGQPDPEEQRAIEQAAANQAAAAAAPASSGAGAQARPGAGATDREQLAAIASKILPRGSVFVGKVPSLIIGSKFVKIGAKFTVTYSGVDYVLELTAIDSTTFTLRLNGEEITRPIKPVAKTSP